MADIIEQLKRDYPDEIIEQLKASQLNMPGSMTLETLFPGAEYDHVRQAILETGKMVTKTGSREVRVQTRRLENGEHEVMALAAVSRDPGRTQDYLNTISDFATQTPARLTQLQQYRRIYETEGMINNAVNKIAALIGVGGRYKVRHARRGKARKAMEELQMALDYVTQNVNNAPLFGVVTGERGLRAVIHAGVRQALIEGDWIGRQQWTKVTVPGGRSYSLPLVIQTISMQHMEPFDEKLAGLGELWYWKPEAKLREFLTRGSTTPEVDKVVKKLVDSKLRTQLEKSTKVLLEPALLMRVKYRGHASSAYGESIIEPAKLGIRYSRAITAIDLVSMENVISRLSVIQVGSSDPKSPYSKPDVAAARAGLMQSFFEEVGPSMIIIWQGDDVKVTDVGSQNSVLDLEARFKVADHKVKMALGLPDALLLGSTGEGSSAGWASVIGAAAQMQELANNFAAVLTTLGERIAIENGFDDVDILWEYDKSLLTDALQTRVQNRADYAMGLVSIRAMIAGMGRDPDAEFLIKCQERGLNPDTTNFEQAFMPPQGLQGQAPGGIQGQGQGKVPGEGRTPTDQQADPTAV
jgi:hypothetical protein